MPYDQIMLAVESAQSRAPQLSNTRLLNYMTERQPPEAKGQIPLFGCAGIAPFTTAGTGPSRGSWNMNGLAYFVQGDVLYSVDASGAVTQRGTGIDGTVPVGMSDNGYQLIIVNGETGYIYNDRTNGFSPITSSAFFPADTVNFFDGYFVLNRKGTNEFFLSALYDGLSYNGLDFASAEAQPGFVTAVVQNLQLEFIICTDHIELWYDAGTEDFPFQRYAGGVIPYGSYSPYTVVKQDGAIFFLGSDRVFYRLQGNNPIRVSTHPIETIIGRDTEIAYAECCTFTLEGHKLVFLTLVGQPGAETARTLCYDIATGRWHDRDSVDELFNSLGRYRVRNALNIYNKILCGDSVDGRIGTQNWDVFTEYGLPMRGEILSANLKLGRQEIVCDLFELDIQAGVGLATGQGSDPQIMASRSIDGGMTWLQWEMWRSMGAQGEYAKRLRWLGQGSGYQMMWRLRCTDPVRRTIIAAYADYDVGL